MPEKQAKWDTDYADYPHIVQIAWILGEHRESHIICPSGWGIPEASVEVHGITKERAILVGEPFSVVIDRFLSFCHKAGLLCGHNIHFDIGIIKANILRERGREYYDVWGVEQALFKGKRIDTMRSSMKWVDARFATGRLKFPNLTELYSRCFPGESFPAHDALADTEAVKRCLPVLLELGLVELKLKEYPEDKGALFQQTPANAPNSPSIEKDDKCINPEQKAAKSADFEKITDNAAMLLQQNDF